MANPNNNGNIIGRLADSPKAFTNADGSKKVYITIYADRNFKNRDGGRDSDAIALEAFVPTGVTRLGVYDLMGKGDLIAVSFSLRSEKYAKDGQIVYKQAARIEDVQLLEPRGITQQRRANEASAQAPAPQAPAPQAEVTDDVAEMERRLAALKAAKAAAAAQAGNDPSESPFGN